MPALNCNDDFDAVPQMDVDDMSEDELRAFVKRFIAQGHRQEASGSSTSTAEG